MSSNFHASAPQHRIHEDFHVTVCDQMDQFQTKRHPSVSVEALFPLSPVGSRGMGSRGMPCSCGFSSIPKQHQPQSHPDLRDQADVEAETNHQRAKRARAEQPNQSFPRTIQPSNHGKSNLDIGISPPGMMLSCVSIVTRITTITGER